MIVSLCYANACKKIVIPISLYDIRYKLSYNMIQTCNVHIYVMITMKILGAAGDEQSDPPSTCKFFPTSKVAL